MSFSDSETNSHSSEYKNFRQVTRERLLYEMLRASKTDDPRSAWRVLIMDKVTLKVMSCSCKMADITDEGISLVEDLFRRRQPLPAMDVIYFIQPTKEKHVYHSLFCILINYMDLLIMFLSDMSGREPLYRKAYVYFSTPVPKDLVARIKSDSSVIPRIGALREARFLLLSLP
nr:protein transport Sec1a-like [Ipomoea batatas]